MFYSGQWYQNIERNHESLQSTLLELSRLKNNFECQLQNAAESKPKKNIEDIKSILLEVSIKINILQNSFKQSRIETNNTTDHNRTTKTLLSSLHTIESLDEMSKFPAKMQKQLKVAILTNECEKEREEIGSRKRNKNRVYHIDPRHRQKTIKTNQYSSADDFEHNYVGTIDDALTTFIDGDILELCSGKHIFSGNTKICGKLRIRGEPKSKWKAVIENAKDSQCFLWCIGGDGLLELENVYIRCNNKSHIIRLSVRAKVIARDCYIDCNGSEGIYLESESKLCLIGCLLYGSVGAGIYVNPGCKCLIIKNSIIRQCGNCAIVLYGSEMDYIAHIVREAPSLHFPSMEHVHEMVLCPDALIASMLRGRTYLLLQDSTIKSNVGFGIGFELPSTFHPLSIRVIASMINVSMTVTDTLFDDNTFGYMGKIPCHWIQNKLCQRKIRRMNPELFPHDADKDDVIVDEETEEKEGEKEGKKENVMEEDDDIDTVQTKQIKKNNKRKRSENLNENENESSTHNNPSKRRRI